MDSQDWTAWLEQFRDWAHTQIEHATVTVTPEQWAGWTDLPYPDVLASPRSERIAELQEAMTSIDTARAYLATHTRP